MKILVLVSAIAASIPFAPAHAAGDAPARANTYDVSEAVQYRDLDLTDGRGRSLLDQRLASAVRKVCGSMEARDLRQAAHIRTCRRQAVASAANGRELALASSSPRSEVAAMTVDTALTEK